MKSRVHRFFLFMAAGLLAAGLFGQEYRGRIQGTVTDTSQAAIVGATVTIVNTGTGVAATRQTSDVGHYLFDLVEPGTYTLNVEFIGFSKFVQENILLQLRGDITVNRCSGPVMSAKPSRSPRKPTSFSSTPPNWIPP